MPDWRIKAAIQGTLSRLPDAQRWNRLFQRYVTHSLDLTDAYFLAKWRQCERHVQFLEQQRPELPEQLVALDLGTGWFPISPVGLSLLGIHKVYSLDIQDLLKPQQVAAVIERYADMIERGTISVREPDAVAKLRSVLRESRYDSPSVMLGKLGITTMIADARSAPLDPETIDLFESNNTFEHIPGDVLGDILKEFRRLAKPDAVMSHYVDMADHYANFDSNISVYNFLKYSEQEWKMYNNDIQYQNRLRKSDLVKLHEDNGWDVVQTEDSREDEATFKKVKLAPEFSRYAEDDLMVYETWLVSRPK